MPARLDFSSRYTRSKGDPESYPGNAILELLLVNGKKHFGALGVLDTGATWTIVGTKFADALKLEYRNAPAVAFVGINNIRAQGHPVDLKLVMKAPNFAWNARVLISEAVDAFPFVLLGHLGFFEHFDVTFQTRFRHFRIQKG